jgi:hypothetical protein
MLSFGAISNPQRSDDSESDQRWQQSYISRRAQEDDGFAANIGVQSAQFESQCAFALLSLGESSQMPDHL